MSVYLTIASLVLFFSFVGWYYLQIKKNRNFFHSTKDKLESAIEAFEEATNGTYFFNHRKANKWRSDNLSLINAIRNHSNLFGLSDSFKVDLRKTNRYFSELESIRNSYNNLFIRKEKVKFKSLFDNVEKYPLDEQQKTAIVHDEDNTLIIAGAGTGKTSTIVGKAAYLIEKGLARPNDLLLISFTKKSAEELGERIKERIGKEVKVKTFNALGYEIIGKVEGAKPDLAFDGNDKAVKNFLNSVLLKMKEDKRLLESLIIFFAYHLVPEKEENHFKSLGEYYQYVKDFELRTLKDERVKSFEELKIANFLYINGINYEYEANFEPVQRDSRFKIYSPDFYLPDYDITIEHFGVNRNGDVPHFFRGKNGVSARDIYWQGIRWKRGTHKFHNKKLIETYSYEYREGTLFDNLQKNLEKENVSFNRIDNEKIFENIKRHQQTPFLIDLICTFLSLVKSNHLSIKELRKRVVIIGDARSSAFLAIFETFFEAYENYLTNKSLIDFNDMLIVASDYIRTNQYRHPYKYVMVDEFQDMSVGRYNLLKSMTDQNPDLKLFCVGDDWQSIYRFTGSDISLTTQFEKYFGYTYKGKIETTYRFNDKILEFTSDFIQKNPYQIKKNLKAKTLYPDGIPFEIRTYVPKKDDDSELINLLHQILDSIIADSSLPGGKRKHVLLIGRYNHNIPKKLKSIKAAFPRLTIDFLTAHRAKGVTYDYSILLDVTTGKYGFPTGMVDDPILNLVLHEEDDYENSEERRLFYVALTRAKHKNFLVTHPMNKSKFINEMEEDLLYPDDQETKKCRECDSLMTRRSGDFGDFWGCSSYPFCNHTEKIFESEKQNIIGE